MEPVYRQNPNVAWRRIKGRDRAVLILPQSCDVFGLTAVATRIWELMETWQSPTALAAAIQAEYDVDEAVVRRDVGELLGQLVERALAEVQPA